MMTHVRFIGRAIVLALFLGCGPAGPKVYPVTGTVKYEDGSIPTGEIVEVHFTPTEKNPKSHPATGAISATGKYLLSSFAAEDGAMEGEYKVTFNILKSYIGTVSNLSPEFTRADQTPYTKTVKPGRNAFDFVVKKKPA